MKNLHSGFFSSCLGLPPSTAHQSEKFVAASQMKTMMTQSM